MGLDLWTLVTNWSHIALVRVTSSFMLLVLISLISLFSCLNMLCMVVVVVMIVILFILLNFITLVTFFFYLNKINFSSHLQIISLTIFMSTILVSLIILILTILSSIVLIFTQYCLLHWTLCSCRDHSFPIRICRIN